MIKIGALLALLALPAQAEIQSSDALLRDHLWRQIRTLEPGERPRVGLVLSAGSVRGLAHIGVIHVLNDAGFPIDVISGTSMGAVIGMEGFKANRRQIFDIGLAGPLAGLVVAVPILWVGIERLEDLAGDDGNGPIAFQFPWLIRLMIGSLRPEFSGVDRIWPNELNPYFMAGWVGLLITGLNMLPVGQLDGGHVIYTLFRKRAHWFTRGFLLLAITGVVIFDLYVWIPMVVLVTLIGTDHPSTSDDSVRLGWFRTLLGYASFSIPILCFPPRVFFLG